MLQKAIADFCSGHEGSLPSERVQNIIKKDHAELYEVSFPTPIGCLVVLKSSLWCTDAHFLNSLESA